MRAWFRKVAPDHAAFHFVPFAVDMCGYMAKETVNFVNRAWDTAAASRHILMNGYV